VLPRLKGYHRALSEAEKAAAAPKKKGTRKRRADGNGTADTRRLATTAADLAAPRPTGYITMSNNNGNGYNMTTTSSGSLSSYEGKGFGQGQSEGQYGNDDGPPPLDYATPAMPPPLETVESTPVFQPPTPSTYHPNSNTNTNNTNGHGHHAHHIATAIAPIVDITTQLQAVAAVPPATAAQPVEEEFDGWT
jgi:hypothetical protein